MLKNVILFLSIAIFLVSCSQELKPLKMPKQSHLVGLASPILLDFDETIVTLTDYFPNIKIIDSIAVPEGITMELSEDQSVLTLKSNPTQLAALSTLNVWIEGFSYQILLKKSVKIKYKFSFDPQGKKYEKVQLAGEINAWNPANTKLIKNGELWETELILATGNYQYQVVLDGTWMLDPTATDSIDNGMGGYNSLLKIGESNSKQPRLFSISDNNEQISISAENNCNELFVFYQNKLLEDDYIQSSETGYNIRIPKNAKDRKRSFIRIWASNENGISNDLFIPLDNGNVLSSVDQLERTDFEAATLYNVFIDRFFNGKPENDRPTDDAEIHPRANYHGGDLAGIIQKIESGYFKELGINTIWISPIVKNPEKAYGMYPNPKTKFSAYHGYWPISFTEIDNRMGTPKELKKLVKLAHDNQLNVLLDFVSNHVHENHPVYLAHKDWATSLYLEDGTLNTEKWDEHRLTTWFDVFLPTLDLEKPEVYEMLSDSAVFWIKEYNLDGFRHDATKHVPEIFWQTLTRKLKEQVIIPENRRLYQIGETYGTHDLVASYVASGQLDAQFDFNMYDAIVGTFARENQTFERMMEVMNKSFDAFGWHHLMGNITGNQDRARFISYAGGAVRFDEDSKAAGWTREIGVGEPVAYQKSAMLAAVLTTIPGVPVVFYGDEIGMPGGNDPDNRKMMRFDDLKPEELKLKETTSKLLKIRQNSLSLIYGDFTLFYQSANQLVYARTFFDKISIIAINNSNEKSEITFEIPERFKNTELNSSFNSEWSIENTIISMKLNAFSFEIIKI